MFAALGSLRRRLLLRRRFSHAAFAALLRGAHSLAGALLGRRAASAPRRRWRGSGRAVFAGRFGAVRAGEGPLAARRELPSSQSPASAPARGRLVLGAGFLCLCVRLRAWCFARRAWRAACAGAAAARRARACARRAVRGRARSAGAPRPASGDEQRRAAAPGSARTRAGRAAWVWAAGLGVDASGPTRIHRRAAASEHQAGGRMDERLERSALMHGPCAARTSCWTRSPAGADAARIRTAVPSGAPSSLRAPSRTGGVRPCP